MLGTVRHWGVVFVESCEHVLVSDVEQSLVSSRVRPSYKGAGTNGRTGAIGAHRFSWVVSK